MEWPCRQALRLCLLPGQRSVSENSNRKEKLLSSVPADVLVTKSQSGPKDHWLHEREVANSKGKRFNRNTSSGN